MTPPPVIQTQYTVIVFLLVEPGHLQSPPAPVQIYCQTIINCQLPTLGARPRQPRHTAHLHHLLSEHITFSVSCVQLLEEMAICYLCSRSTVIPRLYRIHVQLVKTIVHLRISWTLATTRLSQERLP